MKEKLRVGTRRSALAKTQTSWVIQQLERKGISCEVVEILSHGDRDRSQPLYEIETEGPGLFTKQLEQALLEREIDLAVHSLKDLPTLQPEALTVLAVPKREAAHDVLVCKKEKFDPSAPWGVQQGSIVGTSSLRREALLLSRAKIKVRSIRGNVPTRVQTVVKGDLDAVVLAGAGLKRLALEVPAGIIFHPLNETEFISAPAQGALGIEGRKDLAPALATIVRSLQDEASAQEVRWERHVLRELEGGCTLPLGVRCTFDGKNSWKLFVFLGLVAPGSGERTWSGFHHQVWTGAEPSALADKAITHFRTILKK